MKAYATLCSVLLLCCTPAPALISSFGANNLAATIPDGDLTGYQNSIVVSGLPPLITDVNFSFNVSGGFNGDFYAYVTHGNTTSILLNRTGRSTTSAVGYADGGFSVTLDDQASSDVHFYRSGAFTISAGQLTGAWQPDGRAIDPLSAGSVFSSAARNNLLGVFNGMDPNGTCTFFIVDVASGAEGQLNSYSLQFTTVPEPSALALAVLSALGAMMFRGHEHQPPHAKSAA